LPINPDDNVKFIKNYLTQRKGNNTRPFFEKTVSLFPELRCVEKMDNQFEIDTLITNKVKLFLKENESDIKKRIQYFQSKFSTFIPEYMETQCKLYNYEWKKESPYIYCYVGYLPFYPRSTDDKCFFVSYHDEERVFSGAVHEINHMIFHEKWNEMHNQNSTDVLWPHPLWYLEEIVVDPTLNEESVRCHTLFENKAYPQFYERSADNLSIMDKVKDCFYKRTSIESFLEEAYLLVQEYVSKINF